MLLIKWNLRHFVKFKEGIGNTDNSRKISDYATYHTHTRALSLSLSLSLFEIEISVDRQRLNNLSKAVINNPSTAMKRSIVTLVPREKISS